MDKQASVEADRMRAAEVAMSLCLATDLGMGFPFEHGLRATLTTMRLCEVLGIDPEATSQAYFASLLMYSGCTTDAANGSKTFRGGLTHKHTHRQFGSSLESFIGIAAALQTPQASVLRRGYEIAVGLPAAARFVNPHFTAMCEVAVMLSGKLALPESINGIFNLLTERWDGKSILRRAAGDGVPLPLRIIHVARDAAYQRLLGDDAHVIEVIASRSGHAFDPKVAKAFVDHAPELLAPTLSNELMWDAVLAAEPEPWLVLEGSEIDRALDAVGAFADLSSPYMAGHSMGVAQLASAAATLCGFPESEVRDVRRAGFIHDVGKASVNPTVWQKAGSLDADEWEQVRLHPYYTERVFSQSSFARPVAAIACAHHERLDRSGYHRGIGAAELRKADRLLAAASAFRNKTEPRPYREQHSPEQAAVILGEKARDGKLDPEMVSAVVEAAGQPTPKIEWPAGLTEREVQVMRLVARGLQTKQVAHALGVAAKTADHHIQNAYRKIGVSSRAAATLFAAENGLLN